MLVARFTGYPTPCAEAPRANSGFLLIILNAG